MSSKAIHFHNFILLAHLNFFLEKFFHILIIIKLPSNTSIIKVLLDILQVLWYIGSWNMQFVTIILNFKVLLIENSELSLSFWWKVTDLYTCHCTTFG